MRSRLPLLATLALVALSIASCGSKSSTSPGGGSGGPVSGPTFNFTFPATGVSRVYTAAAGDTGSWGYHCMPHQSSGMVGTVVVSTTGADSAVVAVGSTGLNFIPGTVTVKPGGYVRWVNQSAMVNHTVTRP